MITETRLINLGFSEERVGEAMVEGKCMSCGGDTMPILKEDGVIALDDGTELPQVELAGFEPVCQGCEDNIKANVDIVL